MNLVYSVMHDHYPTYIYDEDVVQSGYLGLVKAANKWDEDKGIFSSYAYRGIRFEIQKELRGRNHPQTLSLDFEFDCGDGTVSTLGDLIAGDKDVEYIALDEVLGQLNDNERNIVRMFERGKTCEEISEELSYSKETVYRVVRKFKKLLKGDSE